MPTQKSPLPPQNIQRFNYWKFFPPLPLRFQVPMRQRSGSKTPMPGQSSGNYRTRAE